MNNIRLEPIDLCGCGDTGYLVKQSVPVPLAQGIGKILNVPVYKCTDPGCDQYNLPLQVAQRLDEIAEFMESSNLNSAEFKWNDCNDSESSSAMDETLANMDALTLKLTNLEFEDAKVVFVLPGEIVVLQSREDPLEFYVLRVEHPAKPSMQPYFSLAKFYANEKNFNYNYYLEALDEGKVKELGTIPIEEFEDTLEDEFGQRI